MNFHNVIVLGHFSWFPFRTHEFSPGSSVFLVIESWSIGASVSLSLFVTCHPIRNRRVQVMDEWSKEVSVRKSITTTYALFSSWSVYMSVQTVQYSLNVDLRSERFQWLHPIVRLCLVWMCPSRPPPPPILFVFSVGLCTTENWDILYQSGSVHHRSFNELSWWPIGSQFHTIHTTE